MNLNSKHATQTLLGGLLLAILVATTAAYSPALSGPFLLDDFHNIGTMQGGIETAEDLREHLFVPVAGATNRPIARASLLVNDNAWPSTATQFKWTNLMLHLLCGVLVFAVFRRIFEHFGRSESRAAWLALSAYSHTRAPHRWHEATALAVWRQCAGSPGGPPCVLVGTAGAHTTSR